MKDVVFGYVKSASSQHCPLPLKWIIFLFLCQNEDKFERSVQYNKIRNKGKSVDNWGQNIGGSTTCLMNKCSFGKHIWRFVHDGPKPMADVDIGIVMVVNKSPIGNFVYNKMLYSQRFRIGSEWKQFGWNDRLNEEVIIYINYDDTIKMILDFKRSTLSFRVNNDIIIELNNISKSIYRAYVKLLSKDTGLKLVSYQMTH